jgi:hypothetical protein
MRDDEPASGDCHAAPVGFLHCLQMLANEADRRQLLRTHTALRRAIRACRDEETADRPPRRTRRSMALH